MLFQEPVPLSWGGCVIFAKTFQATHWEGGWVGLSHVAKGYKNVWHESCSLKYMVVNN